MSDPADLPFAESPRGLFSPDEMRRLMRSELARAKRYGFPLSCLLVGIDRLEALHDLYGVDSKAEIYRTVMAFLRRESRASDMVASLTGDRLLLLIPFVDRAGALRLAERMREGARRLDFASDSRALQVTLSIGVAHARTREPEAYDALFRSADDCQRLAASSGGDRVVDVDLLDAAKERPEGERRVEGGPTRASGERRQREGTGPDAPAAPTAPSAPSVVEGEPSLANPLAGLRSEDLMEVVRDALGHLGLDVEDLVRARGASAAGTSGGDLDLQDRRISKLADAVAGLQRQLEMLAKDRDAGTGIASMGKVYGALGDDDDERRKELMGALFKANLALQQRRASANHGRDE